MQIWPAIDLLQGRCVRLQQGDYERSTEFSESPAATASQWFQQGSRFLHCVDLDAAKSGSPTNLPAIRDILKTASEFTSGGNRVIQVGGGIRNETIIRQYLSLGVDRLVVGTSALKDPDWFAAMCDRFPGHLVLGLDARDGMVATEGWLENSSTPATELVRDIESKTKNVVAVVYTDIARDGMMEGPNYAAIQMMRAATSLPIVVSGGVSTHDDIAALRADKAHACIIGRALYEGKIDLVKELAAS